MDDFLPSEVARLVLGYLKDVKCNKSWETFLGENPSLQEYYYLYKNGSVYCTNVGEKSLLDILRLYRSFKKYGKKIVNEIKKCEKEYNSNPDTLQDIIDEIANMVTLTFQKYLSLSTDKCDRPEPESNSSSNIDSNVTEHSDVQNQTFSLAEINKYADECTEVVPCDLSAKATTKQISKINEIGDSTANISTLQEVPSDNNSSFLNSEYDLNIVKSELDSDLSDNETIVGDTSTNISALQEIPSNNNSSCQNGEHDLQILKRELDSHVSDDEMNVGDTAISFNTSDLHSINSKSLERSNTGNKFVSSENNQLSQKDEECTLNVPAQLSSLSNSCRSVENIAAVTTDTEMIDKTEAANENPVFVVVSNEMNCLNTTVQSEKQGVSEANGNTAVNECQDVVKSTDNFILMNNSQYSTVVPPPNQSSALLSYTAIPGFTMPNISSDLSAQNNIGYQLVLSAPIGWNVPIANGLSLVPPQRLSFVPSLPLSNVSKSPVISPASTTAVPTPLLSNVPKQVGFAAPSSTVVPTLPLPSAASQASSSSTAASSHTANFETTVSDNLHDNTKSVTIIKKAVTDLKKSNTSKHKANKKKKDKKESKSPNGKRHYSKRLPKRKRPSLFGSPPKPKENPPAEKIPVSSVIESPCKSSAPNVTKIADDFADHCKSPELKLLMTSAKRLLKASNRISLSHARCLDFNSKAAASDEILFVDEIKKLQENNKSENLPEMLVRNEVQNSKSLTNGNVPNEQCTSKVTTEISDCGGNSKKRKNNDTPSNCKKAKLQKQSKRKKRSSKKITTPQKEERMDVFSVSPKNCFQLKTYENVNKIKSHEVARELYNKASESQNEKVTLESVITTAAEGNKSSRKNNKVQNKKFTIDESPRKSQRIAGKMTAASSNEFLIGERKEFQNESSDHCTVNTVLEDKLSKIEGTSKNPLSPQTYKENEYCETKCRVIIVNVMQNKKSPQKSDKLQDKKTENIDKLPCEKNESQSTNGKDVIISLNKVNESFKISDKATHSTTSCNVNEKFRENVEKAANNGVEKSQNFNKMRAFDNGSELKTIININKNPVSQRTSHKNDKILTDKHKRKCISEKYNMQHNSDTEEKIGDQKILLHTDRQQKIEAIPGTNAGVKTANNPERSILSHTTPSQNIVQPFDTTCDIIETNIERSNDENSELSVMIRNCVKGLYSS